MTSAVNMNYKLFIYHSFMVHNFFASIIHRNRVAGNTFSKIQVPSELYILFTFVLLNNITVAATSYAIIVGLMCI